RPAAAGREEAARLPRGPRRDLPAGPGVRTAERGAAGGREATVREPTQRGRRLASPEGPEGECVPAARAAGALVRIRRRRSVRVAFGVPRVVQVGPPPGRLYVRGRQGRGRYRGVPSALGGGPTQRGVGDRRRGGQGRSDRAAAGA